MIEWIEKGKMCFVSESKYRDAGWWIQFGRTENSLKRFADREEMEIVGIYEDAGKSGKSIEGRLAFKKMLFDIKNGLEIEYILVYKLSRFGRYAAGILNSLEFVQSYGINLICIEEGIDSS